MVEELKNLAARHGDIDVVVVDFECEPFVVMGEPLFEFSKNTWAIEISMRGDYIMGKNESK